jgi:hypothetical protein
MSTVLPLQRWVRAHKPALTRLGIKPVQARGGAFDFQLDYSGTPPYFGRRWAGMIHSVVVVPLPDGTFALHGRRVIDNQAAAGYRVKTTGTLTGDFAALLAGDRLIDLLGRLKLCVGDSNPGGPILPPSGESARFD